MNTRNKVGSAVSLVSFILVAGIAVFNPAAAFAQYNDYSYFDTPSYDYSDLGGYNNYSFNDTPSYDYSDYSSSGYNNYSYNDTPSYNYSDLGSSGYNNYSYYDTPSYNYSDLGSGYNNYSYFDTPNYDYSDLGTGYNNYSYYDTPSYDYSNLNSGTEYAYNPGTEYSYNPGTEYTYNPGTEYTYNPGTEYTYNPGTEYAYNSGTEYTYNPFSSSNWYSDYLVSAGAYDTRPVSYVTPASYAVTAPFYQNHPIYTPAPTSHSSNSTTVNNIDNSINNSGNTSYVDNSVNMHNVGNTNTTGSYNTGSYNYGSAVGNSAPSNVNVASVAPVSQTAAQYPVQYTFPNTSCTITASPNTIQNGASAYLSWSSYGATSAWLSDGIGNVAPNGSMSVRPTANRTYTLTVSDGYGHTDTCSTSITMGNVAYNYPVTPVHPVYQSQPVVTLNQIPYTGFDFGPVGNAIYWASLLSFAAAAAYLVIYFKGGAFAFAGSMFTRKPVILSETIIRNEDSEVSSPESEQAEESAVYAAPVAESVIELPAAQMRTTGDSMVVAHSKSGEIPRLVITRK